MKRYFFQKHLFVPELFLLAIFIFSYACTSVPKKKEQDKPNIIFLVSEDNSYYCLGCYGNDYATTPHLDKLASKGVLYTHAYANAPVCAPARSTLITGVYAPSMGTQHMRSYNAIPGFIRFFPRYLREAGYYTTNRHKKDYNVRKDQKGTWDNDFWSWHDAFKGRKPGQPVFMMYNTSQTHEHQVFTRTSAVNYFRNTLEDFAGKKMTDTEFEKRVKNIHHDPATVPLPPYQPDTDSIRNDWAWYYDCVQMMDEEMGIVLDSLKRNGMLDNSIVFYFSDHGGVLGRSKRFVYETGTHVPFIVYFPKKYRYLAPGPAGSKINRPISFVDLAPTVLSLTGIHNPGYLQGHAFLGSAKTPDPPYVYNFRGRMDERYDMCRSVKGQKFDYIRNYMPYRIYGQHVWYLWKAPNMRSWERMYRGEKCNDIQSVFWRPKPSEELYNISTDPWEVHNLAQDPAYKDTLALYRKVCNDWMIKTRDAGLIPEDMMMQLGGDSTIWQYTHSPAYPVKKILDLANKAIDRDQNNQDFFLKNAVDKDPVIRYWSVNGLYMLPRKPAVVIKALEKSLDDPFGNIRILAAEALIVSGHDQKHALAVLKRTLKNPDEYLRLATMNALDALGEAGKVCEPEVRKIWQNQQESTLKYNIRLSEYLLRKWGKQ